MKALENFSLVVCEGGVLALRHPGALVFASLCLKDTHDVVFLKPLLYFGYLPFCFDLRMDIYCVGWSNDFGLQFEGK